MEKNVLLEFATVMLIATFVQAQQVAEVSRSEGKGAEQVAAGEMGIYTAAQVK